MGETMTREETLQGPPTHRKIRLHILLYSVRAKLAKGGGRQVFGVWPDGDLIKFIEMPDLKNEGKLCRERETDRESRVSGVWPCALK